MIELLFAEAVLGKDAEEFLGSELGRYVVGRAEQEEKEAIDALAVVSSWRRNRIRELQAQVWRARSVKHWLGELIQAGHQAQMQLVEKEAEE